VLKGKVKSGMKNSWTRGILVVFQFTISIGLLVSTFVVYKQVSFFRDKDLGFNKDNILVINRPYAIPRASRESFLNALKEIPSVKEVTATNGLPSTVIGGTGFVPKGSPGNETSIFNFIFTDWDFAKTFELEVTDGRYFSRDFASDSAALVLNQAAVKALGLKDPVIGSHIIYNGDNEAVVVGVVKDFNFESLHKSISPLVLCFANIVNYVAVKIDDNDINTTVANIKSKWNEFVPEQEFDYTFLDQMLDNQYGNEKRTGLIFSSFSILAIIIASLGLLGLASYTTEQRTKEIGIRKVVGASTLKVISILIKEVNILFFIATAIAWPLAWYLMSNWLQNFANRVALSLTDFIIASAITYIIAIITIGYQAIKAANTNPANTLKYE
jgi:putative ABC transport system permease protein